jgi:hypothetical protein
MNDASDGAVRVDPSVGARRPERDQELFAGQHARMRTDEHALRGEIESEITDEPEIVLAHDLTVEANEPAERTADGLERG